MLKASVIGNLGSDPELRYSASEQPTLRMNVASNFRARTPEGEWQDRTEWVRVVVFGQRVETLAPLLKKGMRIYVDGRLEARPWTDRTGAVRAGLEIVAGDVEFAGVRQEGGEPPAPRGSVADERPRPESRADDGRDLDDIPF